MNGIHAEAILKKLTHPELSELLINAKATVGPQIADLSKEVKDTFTHLKKLNTDVSVVRTVNNRLVQWLVKTIKQCWEKAQYSQ